MSAPQHYSTLFGTFTVAASPLIGVAAALAAKDDPSFVCQPQAFNEFSQAGNVVLITGSNFGLGLEMCQALLEAGARAVYTVDLSAEPGEKWRIVEEYVKKMGLEGRMEYLQGDVTNQERIRAIGDIIGEREGRLDVAIANAGIGGQPIPFLDTSAEEYGKVLDVNLKGVLFTAQAAVRQMERFRKPGSIILVASIAGSVHLNGIEILGYQTAKAGVIQLARDLACILAPKKIRVNSLSPGWTSTDIIRPVLVTEERHNFVAQQNPMNRIASPHEMRGPILWLASNASSYCTGSDIVVSGGYLAW